ncbi:hypothetical protein P4131_30145 [Pseudomonas aeruginosa]|nr:hypothetical protein [Pseudomonas aeruginosa]
MRLSVADRQRGRTSTGPGPRRNFAKEGSDCVLERDDSQFVLPPSYTISARLTDRRALDRLGGEYFYNRQDLAQPVGCLAKYRSGRPAGRAVPGRTADHLPADISPVRRQDRRSRRTVARSAAPGSTSTCRPNSAKDGGYHYRYREVQKTSWLNHDEINSAGVRQAGSSRAAATSSKLRLWSSWTSVPEGRAPPLRRARP